MMDEALQRLRDEVLLDGIIEPVSLNQIDSHARELLARAPLADRQQTVLTVIKSLVDDGLMEPGSPSADDFIVESLDGQNEVVLSNYIHRYEDAAEWIWSLFLNLTTKGRAVATSTHMGQRIAHHERERLAANAEAEERPRDD